MKRKSAGFSCVSSPHHHLQALTSSHIEAQVTLIRSHERTFASDCESVYVYTGIVKKHIYTHTEAHDCVNPLDRRTGRYSTDSTPHPLTNRSHVSSLTAVQRSHLVAAFSLLSSNESESRCSIHLIYFSSSSGGEKYSSFCRENLILCHWKDSQTVGH